ncbi:FHA domain-containing protein [Schinkia azotoformans]|uniref:FHA domain-containing protein n=1 Tax=Schinkia azotoformans TaxID=1454 RepID=UPI002E2293B6|nr:FHA domain-containing protein [Schinkia azotoformans]
MKSWEVTSRMNGSLDRNMSFVKDEKYKVWITIIDAFIVMVGIFTIIYVYGLNNNFNIKVIMGILLVMILVGLVIKKYESEERQEAADTVISKFVLVNEAGESVKEWVIKEETSFLIGKQTPNIEVDIDLSDTEYASLINYEHAVLNRVLDNWYIEDIDSIYSIGIKRANKHSKSKLDPGCPSQLFVGDTIYIANTMILVK